MKSIRYSFLTVRYQCACQTGLSYILQIPLFNNSGSSLSSIDLSDFAQSLEQMIFHHNLIWPMAVIRLAALLLNFLIGFVVLQPGYTMSPPSYDETVDVHLETNIRTLTLRRNIGHVCLNIARSRGKLPCKSSRLRSIIYRFISAPELETEMPFNVGFGIPDYARDRAALCPSILSKSLKHELHT